MISQKYFLTYLLVFVVMTTAYSQREYRIGKIETPPVVDGILNEVEWQQTDIAKDFTVMTPVFGQKSEFISKIHMFYDNNAIYIGGELFDPHPDSVSYALSPRDSEGNADWFGISIDTYAKNINSFDFMVTAGGVEMDALESTDDLDFSWNAVWRSATSRTEYGWSFEIKIPYSAIRFPNKNVQEWNINFWRSVRRRREISTWNPINPAIFGEITQSGRLIGVENIVSPLRLSFTPYATGYVENSYDQVLGKQTWKQRLAAGLDLKYGLNDAFTLDMTLIPDFGQTTSDRQVLNLGPFEVRFDENRPFFLEGTELFKTGGIFYSRRIGATPYNYYDAYGELDETTGEQVVGNPSMAPMINGTKVSGRTKNGLGIGVFNSIEGRTEAIISDSIGNERIYRTNPLTNYNIFVLSQNLKNNSTVSFVNTNVIREGGSRDANVTALKSDIYSMDGQFGISTNLRISAITEEQMVFGHAFSSSIGKVAGTWQYGFSYGEESDTYDPNDLGFLYNNNSRSYSGEVSWNAFVPSKYFYRRSVELFFYYEELYKPQLYNISFIKLAIGGLHKKQLYTRLSLEASPFGEVNHFESREFGKEVLYEPGARVRWFFTSDYSKRFALDGRISYGKRFGVNQNAYTFGLMPRVRISDRMNVRLESSVEFIHNDYGYVSILDDNYSDQIILGVRDRTIVENSVYTEFIFTKRMGLDLRLRHYWQQVNYKNFLTLLDEGEMRNSDYNPLQEDGTSLHNTSYNAFTVDLSYTWVFFPGSQLRLVYKNNIFHTASELDQNYFSAFDDLFDRERINSISLKVLFFIDALYFRNKNKNRPEK